MIHQNIAQFQLLHQESHFHLHQESHFDLVRGYNEIRAIVSCLSIAGVLAFILIRRNQANRLRSSSISIRHSSAGGGFGGNVNGKGLIFPIYYTFFFLTLALEVITICLLWIYEGNLPISLSALCWSGSRFITEGLSIFLLQNGVGTRTIKRASLYASFWAAMSYIIWFYIPVLRRHVGESAADGLSFTYLSSLLLFYVSLVCAPMRWLPR